MTARNEEGPSIEMMPMGEDLPVSVSESLAKEDVAGEAIQAAVSDHTASIQALFDNFDKQIAAFSKTTDANEADPKCTAKLGNIAEQVRPFIERLYYEAQQEKGQEMVAHLDNALQGVFDLRMEELDAQISEAGKTDDKSKQDFLARRKSDEFEAQKAITTAALDHAGLLTDDRRMLAASKLAQLGTVKENGSFEYPDSKGSHNPMYYWDVFKLRASAINDKHNKNLETGDEKSGLIEIEVGYVTGKDGKGSVEVKCGKFADKKKAARAAALTSKEKGWDKVKITGFESIAGKFGSNKYDIGMRKEMFLAHIEEGYAVNKIIFDVHGKDVTGYEGIAKHLKMSVEEVKKCDDRARQVRAGEPLELQSFRGQSKGVLSKRVADFKSKPIFDAMRGGELPDASASAETQAAALGLVDDSERYNQLYAVMQTANENDSPEKRVKVDRLLIADQAVISNLEKAAAETDGDVRGEFGAYLKSYVHSDAENIADLSKDNVDTKARLKPLLEKLKPEILVAICGDEKKDKNYANNAERILQFLDGSKADMRRDFLAKLSPEVIAKMHVDTLVRSCADKNHAKQLDYVQKLSDRLLRSKNPDVKAKGQEFLMQFPADFLKEMCGPDDARFVGKAELLFKGLNLGNDVSTEKSAAFLAVLPQPVVNKILNDCNAKLQDSEEKYKTNETVNYGRLLQAMHKSGDVGKGKLGDYLSALSSSAFADTVFARTLLREPVLSRRNAQFLRTPGNTASLNDVQTSDVKKAFPLGVLSFAKEKPDGILEMLQTWQRRGEKNMVVSVLELLSKDMAKLFENVLEPSAAGGLFKMFLDAKLDGKLPKDTDLKDAFADDALGKQDSSDESQGSSGKSFKEMQKVVKDKADKLTSDDSPEGKESLPVGLDSNGSPVVSNAVNAQTKSDYLRDLNQSMDAMASKIETEASHAEDERDPASTAGAGVFNVTGGPAGPS